MAKKSTPVKGRTKAGTFAKGVSGNPMGRTPGTRNAKNLQWERLGESLTSLHAENFNNLMNDLWESGDIGERMKAAELFLKTLDYFKPKLQRTTIGDEDHVLIPPTIVMRA